MIKYINKLKEKAFLVFSSLLIFFSGSVSSSFSQCQTVTASISTSLPPDPSDSILKICQGTSVTFNGHASFSESATGATYNWRLNDSILTVTSTNLHMSFPDAGIYVIDFIVIDSDGCSSSSCTNRQVIHVSSTPIFDFSALPDSICYETSISVGSTVSPHAISIGTVTAPSEQYLCAPPVGDTTFLPDGDGVFYTSSIDVTCFTSCDTITHPEDINTVFATLEHSYSGDIRIRLICPSGNTLLIKNNGYGGSTILGEPVAVNLPIDAASSTLLDPGIGYEYGWSPTSTNGYITSSANWINVSPYTDILGNVSTYSPIYQAKEGIYQVAGDWDALIGCPLNGTWTLEVSDHNMDDNGYIFGWWIDFSKDSAYTFENSYPTQYWTGGLLEDPLILQPEAPGEQCYTFNIEDNFGCHYDTAICLFVKENRVIDSFVNICYGRSYTFFDSAYNEPGTYAYVYSEEDDCDTQFVLHLSVEPLIETSDSVTICEGSYYTWGTHTIRTQGIYIFPGTNTGGCDTLHTIVISVDPMPTVDSFVTICYGSTYTFFDSVYNEPGTYSFIQTEADCDTQFVLHLSVEPLIETSDSITICEGSYYTWGADTISTSGVYTFPGTNAGGCDTLHTIVISVDTMPRVDSIVSICYGSSYTFFDSVYNEPGTYSFTDASGECDTQFVLYLSVEPLIETSASVTICEGSYFTWGIDTIRTQGIYTFLGTNTGGCDTLHTIVISVDTMPTVDSFVTICYGSTYTFFDSVYNESGTYAYIYTDADCDIQFVLHLSIEPRIETADSVTICEGSYYTWGADTISTQGIYTFPGTNTGGCDTLHTIVITVDTMPTVDSFVTICYGSTYTFFDSVYNESGTYAYIYTDADCDTQFVLHLSIEPRIETADSVTICEGSYYTWGADTISTQGIYTFPGTNTGGCDTLHTIVITVDTMPTVDSMVSICYGSSYTFFDSVYNEPGTYAYIYTEADCDTNFILHLSIEPLIETSASVTICEGSYYTWGIDTIRTQGIYTFPGTNAGGCDTLHTIVITVDPMPRVDSIVSICYGSSYTFFDSIYNEPGTYAYIYTEVDCDTQFVLHLSVEPRIETADSVTICEGSYYTWGADTISTSGVYTFPGTNAGGCDTLHTIVITVDPMPRVDSMVSICYGNSYTFFDSIYNEPGTYAYIYTEVDCDTQFVLHLSIEPRIETADSVTICEGSYYTWGADTISTSGVYTFPGTNAGGCDTLHTIVITVDPMPRVDSMVSICYGSSYTFFDSIYNEPGTYAYIYTEVDCDTQFVLHLSIEPLIETADSVTICEGSYYTWGADTISTSGVYTFPGTNAGGCDTLHTIVITVDPMPMVDSFVTICYGSAYTFFDSIYNEPGMYSFTDTSGECDTLYTLDLTILPLPVDTIVASICAGGHYNFYGTTYTSPGIYSHLLSSDTSCDTLKILNLILMDTFRVIQTHTLCESDLPADILGVHVPVTALSDPDFAEVSFISSQGCDSIIVIDLTIIHTKYTYLDTLLCYGSLFHFNGQIIESAGVYADTLPSITSCDSIIYMNVSYTPAPIQEDTLLTGCDAIEYSGDIYTESTTFTDTIRSSVHSCDSVIRNVNIHIRYTVQDTIRAEICPGGSYSFNGRTLTSDTTLSDVFIGDNGCDSTITLELSVLPSPEVSLELINEDAIICIIDTVILQGSGALSYRYYNEYNDPIGDRQHAAVMLRKAESTFYVIGYDENGCSDTSSVTVYANACCDILVPTAFSPNGDGLNDYFGPVTEGHPENYRLEIYNKYGQRVFQSMTIQARWDGLLADGSYADAGVYYYVIQGRCYDGTPILLKGDITLIR